jgi:hypothetical protein
MKSALESFNSVLGANLFEAAQAEEEPALVDPRKAVHADARERKRIAGNIAPLIIEFCRKRLEEENPLFTMTELEETISGQHAITPGSAGRILRDLKWIGRIQYEVKDRAKALYVLWSVS